jgi:Protein of unknown function (DUF4231)
MSAQPASGPAWERLEDQLGWYDRKSQSAQRAFKRLKVLQLVAAAAVPVVAAAEAAAWITAGFGGVVLVLEGVQQLGQYQSNWITYRSTCEALKHEKYLYLAGAGPYRDSDEPSVVLAEHIEGLVSQEHARWVSSREETSSREGKGAPSG